MLAESGVLAGATGQEVSFGRARDGAVAAVTRMVGRDPQVVRAGLACPGGVSESVTYAGGLTLYFTPEAFTGWAVDADGRAWRRAPGTGLRAGTTC